MTRERAISEKAMKERETARKAIRCNKQRITREDCLCYIGLYDPSGYDEFVEILKANPYMTAKNKFFEKYFKKEEVKAETIDELAKKYRPKSAEEKEQ